MPPATEDLIRAGRFDDPSDKRLMVRPDVVAVLLDVWARDVWHAWGGKSIAPTLAGPRESVVRKAILDRGRTPSGILEAFAGIPLHPWFSDTRDADRGAAVEPRVALLASLGGFEPYDELRECVAQATAKALAAKRGTPETRDALWRRGQALVSSNAQHAAFKAVTAAKAPPPYQLGIAMQGRELNAGGIVLRWLELLPSGLTAAGRTLADAANAFAVDLTAARYAGRLLLETFPEATDEAESGAAIPTENLTRTLAKLAALRDAGTLFVDGDV